MSEQTLGMRHPPLDAVLRLAFQTMAAELRVCLPGTIVEYDDSTHLASVQPVIQRRYRSRPNPENLPIIHRVPVIQPRTAAGAVLLPLAAGDHVLLIFADRALDNWLSGDGGPREPLSTRAHHIQDAFAIPGGWPEQKPLLPKYPGALEIQVAPGTKVAITNGSVELLDLFDQLLGKLDETLTQVQALTVTTAGVTSLVPNNSGAFDTLQSDMAEIKSKLGELKP